MDKMYCRKIETFWLQLFLVFLQTQQHTTVHRNSSMSVCASM